MVTMSQSEAVFITFGHARLPPKVEGLGHVLMKPGRAQSILILRRIWWG